VVELSDIVVKLYLVKIGLSDIGDFIKL